MKCQNCGLEADSETMQQTTVNVQTFAEPMPSFHTFITCKDRSACETRRRKLNFNNCIDAE